MKNDFLDRTAWIETDTGARFTKNAPERIVFKNGNVEIKDFTYKYCYVGKTIVFKDKKGNTIGDINPSPRIDFLKKYESDVLPYSFRVRGLSSIFNGSEYYLDKQTLEITLDESIEDPLSEVDNIICAHWNESNEGEKLKVEDIRSLNPIFQSDLKKRVLKVDWINLSGLKVL